LAFWISALENNRISNIEKGIFNVQGRYLKIRILVQGQGGCAFQSAGILWYFEALKRAPKTEIEPKDNFEMPSQKEDKHGRRSNTGRNTRGSIG
jgi:hypothetical protein